MRRPCMRQKWVWEKEQRFQRMWVEAVIMPSNEFISFTFCLVYVILHKILNWILCGNQRCAGQ